MNTLCSCGYDLSQTQNVLFMAVEFNTAKRILLT